MSGYGIGPSRNEMISLYALSCIGLVAILIGTPFLVWWLLTHLRWIP